MAVIERIYNGSKGKPAQRGIENPVKKIRVAAYCRVSTELERQQSSLETQMKVFNQRIREHPGWMLADIYADEGLSGTNAAKRVEFQRMIADAEAGKIDYIITKSISRFARNTLDCIQTVRKLQSFGCQLYFEKENIDTGTAMSEMLLTVLAAFAQEESRSISENLKWGIRKRYEKGEVRWQDVYGYRKGENGEWVVEPNEAEVVRQIFDLYEKGMTIQQIVRKLEADGVPSPRGVKWSNGSIAQIQGNVKYIGDLICQEYITTDHITHKAIKNDATEVPSYYVRDHHVPLVTRQTFERVKRIKEMRNQRLDGDQYPYGYANLRCPLCGKTLRQIQTRTHTDRLCWACFGDDGCRGYALKTSVLNKAVLKAAAEYFPEAEQQVTVEYWWLDEYVDAIEISEHEVMVLWKDGTQTADAIDFGDPRNGPIPQAMRYKDYLDRIASGAYVTKYPKGELARKAMRQAALNGIVNLEAVKV